MIIIILSILVIILSIFQQNYEYYLDFYNYKKINDTTKVYNDKQKFTPINMLINPVVPKNVGKNNEYLNSTLPITADELKKIIKSIKLNILPKDKFYELKGFSYNLIDFPSQNFVSKQNIENLAEKIFKKVNTKISNYLNNKPKYGGLTCPYSLKLKDNRVLKIGINKKKNKIIEGQILIEIINYNIEILIRYVADFKNNNMYFLDLDGFNFKEYLNKIDNKINKKNYVVIANKPIINTYNGKKTYRINSNETNVILSEEDIIAPQVSPYKCYGKNEQIPALCEAIYDSNGKLNKTIGVWDKPCVKNTECLFYKKNKNYPNEYGKCINGKCEMPLGSIQISPRKIKTIDTVICNNCVSGVNCCDEQKDKNKYPDLKSPDYRFKGDEELRKKYLKNTNLIV